MAMVDVNKLRLAGSLVRLARLSSTTAPSGGSKAPPQPPKAPTPAAPPKPAARPSSAAEPSTDPTKYNSNDYYAHNAFSYYDIDATVHKLRIPQPSKFDPLQPKK